ncbi:rac-like gtp-binding protein arac9 [Anaeramoeba ignava]|uniref:Rac-like gtp-binding protein arac9 n=1 Tax=Anaeramoeba ignava TaxID=1746090 RepID=A0A9Q0R565_ANAIG|nr:rac-like gtp-binding protein arac9 [Anaeramoeba ignava]
MTKEIKCVVVGDGAVGKTCALMTYSQNKFPDSYVPTIFENYTCDVPINEEIIRFSLWDTAGQEELKNIRVLSYDGADVIMMLYSTVSKTSLENVQTLWVPEVRSQTPKTPIILVGTKLDLKNDFNYSKEHAEEIISAKEGEEISKKIGAVGFIETSAKTTQNIKSAFDLALRTVLGEIKPKKKKGCILI